MTFNAFIRKLMKDHYLLREDARLAAKLVFNAIQEVLLTGEEVQIPKFGTFYPRFTKGRTWEQPSSGEILQIPPKVRLGFRSTRFFDKQMTQALGESDAAFAEAEEEEDDFDEIVEDAEDVSRSEEADQAASASRDS